MRNPPISFPQTHDNSQIKGNYGAPWSPMTWSDTQIKIFESNSIINFLPHNAFFDNIWNAIFYHVQTGYRNLLSSLWTIRTFIQGTCSDI